ncbi:MAG: DNA-processing protein DprA [Patescibacteria group bacterium]
MEAIDIFDRRWPALLKELPDISPPKTLFLRGTLPPPDSLSIAIVGTRNPTSYGKDVTRDIVHALAPHHIVVVSGLALGIDGVAHRAALDEKLPTIAVLGSGIDDASIYPREHLELAHRIIQERGALISEYEEGSKAARWTFPRRNRIIAGVAHATIVVEANEKSGARITARLASEYSRDVYAVPGSIYQARSRGTNALIKEGATPIVSMEQLIEDLGLIAPHQDLPTQFSIEFSEIETTILRTLDEPRTLDELIRIVQRDAREVMSAVTKLEIRGIIKEIGGGTYRTS